MFIEGKKYKQLRDAAQNGDEAASKILRSYLDDKDDTQALLDDYFKVKEEPAPVQSSQPDLEINNNDFSNLKGLDKFLAENEITKDSPDYDEYVKDYYEEIGEPVPEKEPEPEQLEPIEDNSLETLFGELIDDEIEAAEGYDNVMLEIAKNTEMEQIKREGAISRLQKIKEDEIQHINEILALAKELKIELILED